MSESGKAVFLSYAREDTEPAKRIADALRAFGVEVWFDQSELRGGDSWDQKIRNQIKTCALFVPIVSSRTQERPEGYFRREWKLAVERTHDMAAGVAFIVPIVIDETAESAAAVPDEFMRFQWTRLTHGVPTPAFVEQIKRLLDTPRVPQPSSAVARPATGGTPLTHERRKLWPWFAGAMVVLIALAAAIGRRPASPPSAPAKAVESSATAPRPEIAPPLKAPPAPVAAKSVAVLPFANFSPDKENEFFADGLQDEVITALTKIHDLKVISRTSVIAYKNPAGRNLKQIAADLGVAAILEGSVQRSGTKVHLNVQLIDARTDDHLWADSFTKDLTDVFSVQAELAAAVTSALKATLSADEKSQIARRPTTDTTAYDFYLHARAINEATSSTSREAYDQVVSLYEQAIARDPSFALAQVQLCYTNGIMYWFGTIDPSPARRARAKAALDAALRLAPDLAETRLALGAYSYLCENDWSRALVELKAAQAGLPNDAQLLYLIGLAQRRLGRFTEALATFRRSVELNPRDFITPVQEWVSLTAMRRYAEVIDELPRYQKIFGDKPIILTQLAGAHFALDRDVASFRRQLEAAPAATAESELAKPYRVAWLCGDVAGAAHALQSRALTSIPGAGSVINEPVALHRALLAFLQGRGDDARRQAEEALLAFGREPWTPRQEPWVMVGTGLAHALAGRPDEAVRLAREGAALLRTRDAFNAADGVHGLARVYLVLGRKDEALACLREMMTLPCEASPAQIRINPLWVQLKDDPRFEEILQSAKPI